MHIYIHNHVNTAYKLRILHNPPAIRTRNQNTESQYGSVAVLIPPSPRGFICLVYP